MHSRGALWVADAAEGAGNFKNQVPGKLSSIYRTFEQICCLCLV